MSTGRERNRDDFSTRTKEKVRNNVLFFCQFPGCCQNTWFIKSEVSHICAAAPGGPRYDERQTMEERTSENNAILLCATHAALVDSYKDIYTVDMLRKMKTTAISERELSGFKEYVVQGSKLKKDFDIVKREVLASQKGIQRLKGENVILLDKLNQSQVNMDKSDEELLATAQKLNTISSELKATQSELHTVKDELRTVKDELYTVKDELHTVRDELHTVRDELYTVRNELHTVRNELKKVRNELGAKNTDNFVSLSYDSERYKTIKSFWATKKVSH